MRNAANTVYTSLTESMMSLDGQSVWQLHVSLKLHGMPRHILATTGMMAPRHIN